MVKDNRILYFLVFVMAFFDIAAIKVMAPTISGRSNYIVMLGIIALIMTMKRYKLYPEAKAYVIALCVGFILHAICDIEEENHINGTLIVRLIPIFLLSMYIGNERNSKVLTAFVFVFLVAECLLSFYERINSTHVFYYESSKYKGELFSGMSLQSSDVYRSFALMGHPLFNANTVSVAMAFILCCNRMKLYLKLIMLGLGFVALWGFNSRGCLLVWGVILLYRFVFYDCKWWQMAIALVIVYLLAPLFLDWLISSGLTGRLGDFDFSDDSTATRLIAFQVFSNARWNIQDIIVGGRLITYYASTTTLENGVLLDLCFWGFIVGPIKIASEILLTWRACHHFPTRAKFIIMMATWGVAMMNNNSNQTWLMPMFVLFCIGFAQFQSRTADVPAHSAAQQVSRRIGRLSTAQV